MTTVVTPTFSDLPTPSWENLWAVSVVKDLIGLVLQTPEVRSIVIDSLDMGDVAAPCARLLDAALHVDVLPDADLGHLDDHDGFGPSLLVDGQLIVERPLLARLVTVAKATGTPITVLAQMVVGIPCSPSWVPRMVRQIGESAALRRKLDAVLTLLHGLSDREAWALDAAERLVAA
jgi:hypothetical protein